MQMSALHACACTVGAAQGAHPQQYSATGKGRPAHSMLCRIPWKHADFCNCSTGICTQHEIPVLQLHDTGDLA